MPWRHDLAGTYMNPGQRQATRTRFGSVAGIADYGRGNSVDGGAARRAGRGLAGAMRNDLATAYVNRGVAKRDAPGFGPGAAIADCDAAVALIEALRDRLGEGCRRRGATT